MYKIDETSGEVSVVLYFEPNEMYSLLELEFDNKPSDTEIMDIIKQHTMDHAESIASGNSVSSIDMIMYDKNNNEVDYKELDLKFKCIDKDIFDTNNFTCNDIEYIED